MFLRQFFLHLNHHLCYSRISNSSFIGEIKMQSSVRYIWKWYPHDYTLNWMRTIYVIIMSSLIYFFINRYILFFILYHASLNPNNSRYALIKNSCVWSKEQKWIQLSFEKFSDWARQIIWFICVYLHKIMCNTWNESTPTFKLCRFHKSF